MSEETASESARCRERTWRQIFFRSRTFSPMGFFVRAAFLSLFFGAAHLLGFRAYTSIFCGTLPAGGLEGRWAIIPGIAYGVLYMAFVLGVPALILGGLLFLGASFRAERRAERGAERSR